MIRRLAQGAAGAGAPRLRARCRARRGAIARRRAPLAQLLTRTLSAEQVQHHDQHRLPVRRGQGLLVLWHRRLRRLSASGRTRSSGARTASGSGFGFHGTWVVECLVAVSSVVAGSFLSSPVPVKTHATRTATQSLEVIIYGTISAISLSVAVRTCTRYLWVTDSADLFCCYT